jgi:hypothetical protein
MSSSSREVKVEFRPGKGSLAESSRGCSRHVKSREHLPLLSGFREGLILGLGEQILAVTLETFEWMTAGGIQCGNLKLRSTIRDLVSGANSSPRSSRHGCLPLPSSFRTKDFTRPDLGLPFQLVVELDSPFSSPESWVRSASLLSCLYKVCKSADKKGCSCGTEEGWALDPKDP